MSMILIASHVGMDLEAAKSYMYNLASHIVGFCDVATFELTSPSWLNVM